VTIRKSVRNGPRCVYGGLQVTQANQLRVIGNNETFSATTKYVTPKKVEAVFSIRRDAKSSRYEKKTLFDFSGVSEEQLYLLAMYGAKVKLQAILRALSPQVMLNTQTMAVVDVQKDLLDVEKASADPTTAAIKSIQKATGLDETAARAMLAQAKVKAAATKSPKTKAA
jgi:hypothetical protein